MIVKKRIRLLKICLVFIFALMSSGCGGGGGSGLTFNFDPLTDTMPSTEQIASLGTTESDLLSILTDLEDGSGNSDGQDPVTEVTLLASLENDSQDSDVQDNINPEPSTIILLGSGLLGLAVFKLKKKRT